MKNKFNKKKIKTILKYVKKGFEEEMKLNSKGILLALCSISIGLSWEEHLLFKRYLKYTNKNKKVYYSPSKAYPYKIIKCTDKNWYHWHPRNHDIRLKWLNKHIKLNTNNKIQKKKKVKV